jgi:hypothetical protein
VATGLVLQCSMSPSEHLVSEEEKAHWGPHWTAVNIEFEAKLASNPHLRFLCGRMFFICDGNHRFIARTGYIKRLHKDDQEWHYSVDSICLDTKGVRCSAIACILHRDHSVGPCLCWRK